MESGFLVDDLYTCALVGASDFNGEHFKQLDKAEIFDGVVAIDGGMAWLDEIGRKPDLALGDFDSLGYVPHGVEVRTFDSHKDKSDMELAVDYAFERGFNRIIVYGALGRRLDHTLANLQVFADASERGLAVSAIGTDAVITFVTGPGTVQLPKRDEGVVSVFSMNDQAEGVYEEGLEYPLHDAVLNNRSSLGLSNEYIGNAAEIGVDKGTLLVIHPL